MRAWSWDSRKPAVFAAWQEDVALVVDEVGHLAHAESPGKRMKRRVSGREHLCESGRKYRGQVIQRKNPTEQVTEIEHSQNHS